MTKTKPRISIGLPVYNGELYLAESIDSLLAQTFTDFELIISDNGSSDGTQNICEQYAKRDDRVRYYRVEENLGCAWNMNRVLELSQGEYFKWAADDDIHLPTFLAKTKNVLEQNPEVEWCFCRHIPIGPTGQVLTNANPEDSSLLNPNGWDRTSPEPHQRFQSILFAQSGLDMYALFRREVIAKTKGFQPFYGAEKVLLGEFAMLGKYHEIPETLFHLRVHPQASSSLDSEAELQQFMDPNVSPRFSFTRLRLLRAHWATLHRYKLSFSERAKCYLELAHYLLQVSKWKRILISSFRGRGNGGGYLPALDEIEKEPKKVNTDGSASSANERVQVAKPHATGHVSQ